MPVRVTLSGITPSGVPTNGWKVGYRIKGTSGAYITPVGSPYMAQPIIFNTTDPAGTLYEGFIQASCSALDSTQYMWVTPCACPATYAVAADGLSCFKNDVIAATVTNSGYCLAASTNAAYSTFETRIYTTGFTTADLNLAPGSTGSHIYGRTTLAGQWANPTSDPFIGPLNREGVWVDSDCDHNKDSLLAGAQATISYMYNNLGATRTIYVGIGADNQFQVKVNGALVADSEVSGGGVTSIPFRIWHIIPITIISGVNYVNVIAKGDGTTNDSVGMVMYDNTAAQILSATSDSGLSILFKTSSLRNTGFDVATCPTGYSLDTSGGAGSYVCTKTLTSICNP